jgi:hypothetical protein
MKTRNNPRSRLCSAISGYVSVGDYMCISAASTVPDAGLDKDKDKQDNSHNKQMLKQFRAWKTFRQVKNLDNMADPEDEDVLFDMNPNLKREALSSSLGRFNSRIPQDRMLVQTGLLLQRCRLAEVIGNVFFVHMEKHDQLMDGLLNVYFLDSLYEPVKFHLDIKSNLFHVHSSVDLYCKSHPGFISHLELQFNQLVKVVDAVCKMRCWVAASQPHTNRVHIDMYPAVWLLIKDYLVQETKDKKFPVYHDKDTKLQTIKRGVCVTLDKRIQLATVERETEEHHKLDRIIAYTREHISIMQCVFGFFFGIGARVRHPKPKSEQDKSNREWARNLVMYSTSGLSSVQHFHPLYQAQKCLDSKVATSAVTRDIRINTLTQLQGEDTLKKEWLIEKYVNRGLEGMTLLFDWASHRLTICVGYNTPMFSDTDEKLFSVFKSLIDDFSSGEEQATETYPEKGKHLFYNDEMHDVLHCDGGDMVLIAPSLRHLVTLSIAQDACRKLISEFYDTFSG